jgi:hypothetical protein
VLIARLDVPRVGVVSFISLPERMRACGFRGGRDRCRHLMVEDLGHRRAPRQ